MHKEGEFGRRLVKQGVDDMLMYLLTKFGSPTPWSPEDVVGYAAKLKQELDWGRHIYDPGRRMWGKKPFETTVSDLSTELKFEVVAA